MNIWVLVLAAFINGEVLLAVKDNGGGKPLTFKSKEACELELKKDDAELKKVAQHPYELACLTKSQWDKLNQKQQPKDPGV